MLNEFVEAVKEELYPSPAIAMIAIMLLIKTSSLGVFICFVFWHIVTRNVFLFTEMGASATYPFAKVTLWNLADLPAIALHEPNISSSTMVERRNGYEPSESLARNVFRSSSHRNNILPLNGNCQPEVANV